MASDEPCACGSGEEPEPSERAVWNPLSPSTNGDPPSVEPERVEAHESRSRGESRDEAWLRGESRSRGVIGGVDHVRGEALGHERGVSSPMLEPATELEGDERRERDFLAFRCCA